VVLVPPPAGSDAPPGRVPPRWPDGDSGSTLTRRLAQRLPAASVEFADPQTVAEARAWLADRDPLGVISLRVERAYCADTVKDGFFGLAQLRAVTETAPDATAPPGLGPEAFVRREVLSEPSDATACATEALARSLEQILALPSVQRTWQEPAAESPPDGARWSRASIRALFPGIGERIEALLVLGRSQLASGRVAAAADTFRRAAAFDPEDATVRTFIAETDATLALAEEIAGAKAADDGSPQDPGVLDPRFSPAQRAAAEARLAVARQQRADLLAMREVLDARLDAPTPATLAALRSGPVGPASGFGPAVARERAPEGIQVRIAVAPDGHEIARYYVARGGTQALLREEDADANGVPDRWIAYADGHRSEIWEDGRGRGRPDLHFVYTPGSEEITRVELDTGGDGHFDRIFEYAGGDLRGESQDTNDDGVLDRFVQFDPEGRVSSREEDLDNDGRIDMRATYRAGRLLERTYREAEFEPDDT